MRACVRVRVCIALGIRQAKRMRHIIICSMPGSTVFFYIISKTVWFSKKVTENKMRVLSVSTTFVWNISYYKKNWRRYATERSLIQSEGCLSFISQPQQGGKRPQ